MSGRGFAPGSMLVTGGAGFIGSNFVRFALRADPQVHVHNLDALTYAGSLENLGDLAESDRHHFIEGEIGDRGLVEDILRRGDVRAIVHLAAETHVDRSITDPAPFIAANVVGTFTLLEAARRVWLEERGFGPDEVRFHQVSTDEVYGSLGPDDPPCGEAAPYAPSSPYAASKAAADHLARAYAHTYRLPLSLSNCTNNYGPRQLPEKLVPLAVWNGLRGRPIPIYGDGRQVRDWLYVEDHCSALWRVLQQGKPGEVYHVSGGDPSANEDLVRRICRLLDEHLPNSLHRPHEKLIAFVPDRPGHDRRYALDSGKIRHELGWTPTENLEAGLRKTVAWYVEHQDWLSAMERRPPVRERPAHRYGKREAGP